MRSARLLAFFCFLMCGGLQAQFGLAPATQTFDSPALGLSFRYLAALNKEDSSRMSEFERAVFSLHPEQDLNHAGTDPCTPLVLVLGSGLDRPAEIPQKGKPALLTAKGTLTLSEVKRSCLEQDAVDDTTLANLVGQTEKLDGMRPLQKTSNAFIQGTTVWWATSAGFLKDAKGKRTAAAGTVILGSVAAVVNGHVLLWSITANDPALFNRLLDLSVCFDSPECKDGYSRLVHFQLATHPNAETASR